ncbi:tyrosine-type recombinase/integrase [Fictibacillus sp. KIGAM418]|uniref:Tyrosine-type recombinase/integrase n=1 Tax=Fictibacillus marinisediminis TaxID=2878389 RepID=A0A9X1XAU8_9BACL|nr:tyrosine-type recombinase/integrase [Fictibacillus marinisediminis]MCK6256801.1 tyrosine-type recombinase/integrase [Fictibacillus marinisediminis]
MDKRTGKRMIGDRSGTTMRKSLYELDALFQKYLSAKTAEGRAPSMVEKYKRYYRFFCDYLDNQNIPRDIRKIDTDVIRLYSSWMLNDKIKFDGHTFKPEDSKTPGLSAVTVNDRLKILRAWFRFLADEQLIDEDPMKRIKNAREESEQIQVLSPQQLRALLAAPNQRRYAGFRDACLLALLIDSMCRINEALNLKKTDIDFASSTINIRAEIAKSRKSRILPIQKRTARLLKELIEEVACFNSEYVFLANYGEPLTANHFRKQLRQYAEKAGITQRIIHPHLLRHTGATMFLEAGGDIRHLQMLLGHSDLRMVLRYTHLSKQSLIAQHEQYSPMNNVIEKRHKERKILR